MSAEEFKTLGNKALQANNYDEAIDMYTKAINLDGTQHVYFSNRSAAYLTKGDALNALDDADKCVQLNPSWAKGYSRKGAALHKLKRYDEAEAAFSDGLKIAPKDDSLNSGLQEVRKAKASSNNNANASGGGNPFGQLFGPDLISKLATNPKFSGYLSDPQFLTKLRLLQSNPNAIGSMIQDPQMMEVISFLLGINMQTAGENDDLPFNNEYSTNNSQNTSTKKSTSEQTTNSNNNNNNNNTSNDPNLTEEEKIEAVNKNKALQFKTEGNNYYKSKQFLEALNSYDNAIALDPKNMTYLSNKSAVYFEMKEFDNCISTCRQAIQVGRENRADYIEVSKNFIRIAKAYQKLDQYDNALEAYQSAQLENYTKETERAIKTLELEKRKRETEQYINPELGVQAKERGNEFFRSGDYPSAVAEYEDAVKRDPTNASYRNNLAATLTKLGDFNGAKKACEKAIEIDPKYVKAWAKKGDIEFFMKEYHKALDSYKKGLELDPENSLCKTGLQKTLQKINESSNGEVDRERAAHGMADPEVQSILMDPIIQNILRDLQENPASGQSALRDPVIRAKIEKLIAAGVLQTR